VSGFERGRFRVFQEGPGIHRARVPLKLRYVDLEHAINNETIILR